MQLFINQVVGSILQLILFSAVPFLWWYYKSGREQTFWQWIGFKRVENFITWKTANFLLLAILALGWLVAQVSPFDVLATNMLFAHKGLQALPAAFVYAVFHTSLSEEIFFRGFLLKRLISRLSFRAANLIQAAVFGLLHGLLFGLMGLDLWPIVLVSIFPFLIALCIGWFNEKRANGSILPGWYIHAAANFMVAIGAILLG